MAQKFVTKLTPTKDTVVRAALSNLGKVIDHDRATADAHITRLEGVITNLNMERSRRKDSIESKNKIISDALMLIAQRIGVEDTIVLAGLGNLESGTGSGSGSGSGLGSGFGDA